MTQQDVSENRAATGIILQLSCSDFQRNPDGSWVTTRQINVSGPGGDQMLIGAGRQVTKGQMFIFGLDLAAILERQCTQ